MKNLKSSYSSRLKSLVLMFCFLIGFIGFSQSNRPKHKSDSVYTILLGQDKPTSNYKVNVKVEEGILVKGQKEGVWTTYYPDGKTPKLKGKYSANKPNGWYEKFYPSGAIKEKGVFSNKHYTDTIFHFFPNGKMANISIYDEHGKQIGTTQYFYANGNIALTYQSKNNHIDGNVIWHATTGEITRQINVKKHRVTKPVFHNEVAFSSNTPNIVKGFNAMRIAGPIVKDNAFDPNGYNVVYNKQDELFQVGSFKFGTIYNGKVYNYDANGILKSISIYRDGYYYSEGNIK